MTRSELVDVLLCLESYAPSDLGATTFHNVRTGEKRENARVVLVSIETRDDIVRELRGEP